MPVDHDGNIRCSCEKCAEQPIERRPIMGKEEDGVAEFRIRTHGEYHVARVRVDKQPTT